MLTKNFQQLYSQLNPEQKKAVDSIEGPVMVVAGPGTGKTQALTLRVANILLKTDIKPENILALTFTESATASMRRRLAEIIGSPAYSVNISTFHGFCNNIINNYPEDFSRIVGFQAITEVEQIKIIESLLEKTSLDNLKPFGDKFYYLRPILANINQLKREAVSPERFKKIIENNLTDFDKIEDLHHQKGPHKGKMKGDYQKLLRQITKNKELAEVYQEYQEKLSKNKWYDYNDMIMKVLEVLTANKNLLLILQEQYQYLLVDEHQDTNNSQNKILELLCNFHSNPNVFVVGDEKQAIFRFQGASVENFLYFKKLYPQAQLIVLKENYRSTQTILNSAEALLASANFLKSNTRHPEKKITVSAFSSPEAEIYFLGKDIAQKISGGIRPSSIAVLYRENKDALPIAYFLEKLGVPFIIESDQDILHDQVIKKIILLMSTVEEIDNTEKLLEAMHIDFLQINSLDLYQLILKTERGRKSLLELLRSSANENISRFANLMNNLRLASRNLDLLEFFEFLVRESGYLKYILAQSNAVENIEKINSFFSEIKLFKERNRDGRLRDFLDYLTTLQSHNLLIKKNINYQLANKVRLMTVHRAKGLEFDFVYIANVYDNHWGGRKRPEVLALPVEIYQLANSDFNALLKNADSQLADERRLFYVALTRSRKEITISYAKFNNVGQEQLICRFVEEIHPELVELDSAVFWEEKFLKEKDIFFKAAVPIKNDIKDKEFIKNLFLERGLSVTHLNNYLSCPWKYFYENLLLLPKAKTKQQMYGTAVHVALKDFFNALTKRDPEPTKNFLLEKFSAFLKKEPLAEKDFSETLQRGQEALADYFDNYQGRWSLPVLTEFNVLAVMLAPDIRLTGKIDKLEFLNDGVNVVDYKTSQPKTRGEIEGTTKNSTGDIKRQLVFYNLLLNRHNNGKYKMVSGEIDFVHPDEKNRFHKEKFIIEKEAVVELENLIKNVAQEILSLAFWDKKCGDKECQYCRLRKVMV